MAISIGTAATSTPKTMVIAETISSGMSRMKKAIAQAMPSPTISSHMMPTFFQCRHIMRQPCPSEANTPWSSRALTRQAKLRQMPISTITTTVTKMSRKPSPVPATMRVTMTELHAVPDGGQDPPGDQRHRQEEQEERQVEQQVDQEGAPGGARPAVAPALAEADLDAAQLVLVDHADGGGDGGVAQEGEDDGADDRQHDHGDQHGHSHLELGGVHALKLVQGDADLAEEVGDDFAGGITAQPIEVPVRLVRKVLEVVVVEGVGEPVAGARPAHGQRQQESEHPQHAVLPDDVPRTLEDF